MMSKFPARISAARRNAEALLSKSTKNSSTYESRKNEQDALSQKTARLRELRLAKEAADRELEASNPSPRTKVRRTSRR